MSPAPKARASELIEATMFKRVGDGFVLRTPGLWPFRSARYYRVDDARKDAILAHIERHRTRGLLLVLVVWLMLIAGLLTAVALLPGRDHPMTMDLVVVSVLALLLLIVCLQCLAVLTWLPVTGGLMETSERFTFQERLAAGRNSARLAMPFQQPLLLGALNALECAANTAVFLLRTQGAQHITWRDGLALCSLFLSILFCGLAIHFFYLDFIRARPVADPGPATGTETQTNPLVLRLERMERESLRLRRALTGVTALASALGVGTAAVAATMLGATHSAEADRYVLRDSQGQTAALLTTGKDNSPALSLYGPDKTLRMFMGLTSTGDPQLAFYGPEQVLRFLVGMARDGLPVVRLNGADGTLRVGLVVNSDDSWLTLSDPRGTARLSLSAGAAGGHVSVLDAAGNERERP